MKFLILLSFFACSFRGIPALLVERQKDTGGTGPYPAGYTTDTALESHTIYAPKTIPSDLKLPVMLWGEGGCSASGTSMSLFLTEIASHGFLIIASGAPGGSGTTTTKMMNDSLAFIVSKAGSGKYAQVDVTAVAAAGYSCGGLEALDMKDDPRLGYIGVFDSGYLQNQERATTIKKPVFYFLGGSTDVAYANGERDYKNLPAGTPSWKGNLPVGHGGTYFQANGGKFAIGAVNWLQWVLKKNTTSAAWFTDGGAQKDGWSVEMKDLDKMKV